MTLAPDAFQVGVVSRLDDTSSYDPYWLVVNDGVFTPVLPTGFAWRAPTGVTASREVASIEAATSGFAFDSGVLLIKTPLDGQPTLFR